MGRKPLFGNEALVRTTVRLPAEALARVEVLAARLTRGSVVPISPSDVLRAALVEGLRVLERKHGR